MNLLLHEQTRRQLDGITGSRSGSYIFHGGPALGKASAAADVARLLNCLGDERGSCLHCRQFLAGNYPDFLTVRPEDKPSILIEQVRRLIQAMSLSLYHATGSRVVLIDGAHTMTTDAQNALLKLIEEPPPQTLFILVTEQLGSLLPTVRSRCAAVFFPKLSEAAIAGQLTSYHGLTGPQSATLAAAADGAVGNAIMLAGQPELAKSRAELAQAAETLLSAPVFDRLLLAGRLAGAKADLSRLGHLIQSLVLGRLKANRETAVAAARQLEALELFRCQLDAKVMPKVALERLVLEL